MYFFLECRNGTYGYGCVNNCSDHCIGDSTCNKQTGYCDRGCKPGYTNSLCKKVNKQKLHNIIVIKKSLKIEATILAF